MTTKFEVERFICASTFDPSQVLRFVPEEFRHASDAQASASEQLAVAVMRESAATGISPREIFDFHADCVDPT